MPKIKPRTCSPDDACCGAPSCPESLWAPPVALEMAATPARANFQEPLLDWESPASTSTSEADSIQNGTCLLAHGDSETMKETRAMQRKLILVVVVASIFMVVEVVGGFMAHSVAIMTDAAHLLSDTSGFGVALFASIYATKKSMSTHTFGYHRIEVLGALASVLSTWLVTGALLYEAVNRLIKPTLIDGKLMFILAVLGLVVNISLFVILGGHHHGSFHSHSHDHSHTDVEEGQGKGGTCRHGHHHNDRGHSHAHAHDNINMRGAIIHALGDLVQSVGVVVASALIWWKEDSSPWILYADPACTFVFAFIVLCTTVGILRDISDILMERVPRGLDADIIQADLQKIVGVVSVHDLHVWALKPGVPLLATHLNIAKEQDVCAVLMAATSYCVSKGITHSTIQLLHNNAPCCIPA
ncbi:hypothetical protein WJX75_000956 [Coccomyxa subellipsoidea]|uniref:Cation efflux protein transmembrane domain-containing protein n=1 Tax=Coccomyxa subellipsoidea TaxID=248742 RepID=A0ABR2YQZ6_9CHLO